MSPLGFSLRGYKKKVKRESDNFNNACILTHSIPNISVWPRYKNDRWDILHYCFLYWVLRMWCVFHAYSTSQWELFTLQGSRWPRAALWDRRGRAGEENIQANRQDIVYFVPRRHASLRTAAHAQWQVEITTAKFGSSVGSYRIRARGDAGGGGKLARREKALAIYEG